jgi:hypothetical protein
MGWIHNICGGGSHSFFHGDNEDRTRHLVRFARNGSRGAGGASSRERRQQYPGRLRRLESGIPQSMSLVGTWILADSSQSGGLDFRFVVAMVESPKGAPFPLSTLAKKTYTFLLFLIFFFLLKSVPFSFLFFYPSPNLLRYLPQTKASIALEFGTSLFLFFSFLFFLAGCSLYSQKAI